jgi:hypothetical protein
LWRIARVGGHRMLGMRMDAVPTELTRSQANGWIDVANSESHKVFECR